MNGQMQPAAPIADSAQRHMRTAPTSRLQFLPEFLPGRVPSPAVPGHNCADTFPPDSMYSSVMQNLLLKFFYPVLPKRLLMRAPRINPAVPESAQSFAAFLSAPAYPDCESAPDIFPGCGMSP